MLPGRIRGIEDYIVFLLHSLSVALSAVIISDKSLCTG